MYRTRGGGQRRGTRDGPMVHPVVPWEGKEEEETQDKSNKESKLQKEESEMGMHRASRRGTPRRVTSKQRDGWMDRAGVGSTNTACLHHGQSFGTLSHDWACTWL